ncbi:MAG: 30S ribosomal protein S6 [Solirubrobacterales bacterium]|nr:30S ribosomal protein S6 [Solirubrobacterales bacterium]
MPSQAPVYDLVLALSTSAEEDQRAKILGDIESQISGEGGQIARRDDWGTRPLAYQINHQREGEYHLLQFTGPPTLLEALSHGLRIADEVLRFRIIKVLPGTPPPPESAPPAPAGVPAPAAADG